MTLRCTHAAVRLIASKNALISAMVRSLRSTPPAR